MQRWRSDKLQLVLHRLEDLDRDLEMLESMLAAGPPAARLTAETKLSVQALYKELKTKLTKASKENYQSTMGEINELEAWWFPTVQTVLHRDLSERVDSVDKGKLAGCIFEARSTVADPIREVREALAEAPK